MQPDLATFQRRFVAAIDAPATGPLAVYRNTVIHGAVEALRSNFPVVEQIVGEEMFAGIAAEFSTSFPPRSPVLALHGEQFAEWLAEQAWIGDLLYLPDVARVERLHVECLMAADADALAGEPTGVPGLQLRLHPAVRFGWLRTPGMSIWLAHQRPMPSVIEPDWKSEGALFARPSPFVMHTPRIGAAAHRILSGIRLGERVEQSLSAAARLYPNEDTDAVYASLINLGAFAAPSYERS
ncbi:DNA-binding domain-containing protein [Sphingomonas sp. SM33]|uniref:DNA-binding domain-containing protein n=1 Tax=Sphingomonas telluris TaxID=2907998 RepID=A0ABS9VJ43_9SPHN|nr:DNA-binding domain-containing protein [Sphingomonas telluris]MCH8614494.1 DNA-binding domain-containing protein [Sphingomonas telluris]